MTGAVKAAAQPLIASSVRHSNRRLAQVDLVLHDIIGFLYGFLPSLLLPTLMVEVGKHSFDERQQGRQEPDHLMRSANTTAIKPATPASADDAAA